MRKRVLILEGSKEPREASADGEAYRQFLMSPYGGCWASEEIECVPAEQFSESELKDKLNSLKGVEYFVFVYCAAQGDILGNESNARLRLREGEEICVADVSRIAKRQLTIIDCCWGISADWRATEAALMLESTVLSLDSETVRETYEQCVQFSDYRQYVLYLPAPGAVFEGSGEACGKCSQSFISAPVALMKYIEGPYTEEKFAYIEAGEAASLLAQEVRHPQVCSTPGLPWVMNPSRLSDDKLRRVLGRFRICRTERGCSEIDFRQFVISG